MTNPTRQSLYTVLNVMAQVVGYKALKTGYSRRVPKKGP
jgi:hypothetical protein